jgi:hypothetical protein
MIDAIEAGARRNRFYRNIFLGIILFTLPFYCLGFVLWGMAPRGETEEEITATNTIIGEGEETDTPEFTRTIIVTRTVISTLPPTPGQFNPIPTSFLPPTVITIPPATFAPTLTFAPTNTTIPTNTWTLIPPPTNTFVPTNTTIPPTPIPPTNTPTEVFIPLPSDTPQSVIEPTPEQTTSP